MCTLPLVNIAPTQVSANKSFTVTSSTKGTGRAAVCTMDTFLVPGVLGDYRIATDSPEPSQPPCRKRRRSERYGSEMRSKRGTAARRFLCLAVALVSGSASAAPPDGADPNSPLGAWY